MRAVTPEPPETTSQLIWANKSMLPSARMAVAAALSALMLPWAWFCGETKVGGVGADARCGGGAGGAASPVLKDAVPTASTEAADNSLEIAVGGSRAVLRYNVVVAVDIFFLMLTSQVVLFYFFRTFVVVWEKKQRENREQGRKAQQKEHATGG